MKTRTIAAVATPVGMGGIAVIRVSGKDSISICESCFTGKKLSDVPTHTIHYGHIVNKNKEIIDEVLVSVMRAPKTYTREDVVEISTHGGIIASKNVLKCLIEAGAYPAEPGEFTKRAFLNGRIDLSQAEAIIDIINSKTDAAQKNALSQVRGGLSQKINSVRNSLVGLCASMQVLIDYPDEELEDITIDDISVRLEDADKDIEELIKTSENGKIIKNGIRTVIAGQPNVGKSSLLNFMAREERAIVTEIAGTTRDVIEETVSIDGVPLILTDTAGIRQTEDVVEKIGVKKSKEAIEGADLLIVVMDSERVPSNEEKQLLEDTKNQKRIVLINKTDIKNDEAYKKIREITDDEAIDFSTKTGTGQKELYEKIKELYNMGKIGTNDSCIVTNMRHVGALVNAKNALKKALESIDMGMPSDIVSIDINIAIDHLGEITGAVVSDDIVSAIFHDFCVGK